MIFTCKGREEKGFRQVGTLSNLSMKLNDVMPIYKGMYILFIYKDLSLSNSSINIRIKRTHGSWEIAPLFIGT